jgi:predicted nucleic acid-binding protein
MKYLLDVNALIAWYHANTAHHDAFHQWAAQTGGVHFATCAITELGFIRVSMSQFGYSLTDAENALEAIRAKIGGFVADCASPRLPAWANTAAKTTDAYLCQIAEAKQLKLATFDRGIKSPAVFLIPQSST